MRPQQPVIHVAAATNDVTKEWRLYRVLRTYTMPAADYVMPVFGALQILLSFQTMRATQLGEEARETRCSRLV